MKGETTHLDKVDSAITSFIKIIPEILGHCVSFTHTEVATWKNYLFNIKGKIKLNILIMVHFPELHEIHNIGLFFNMNNNKKF